MDKVLKSSHICLLFTFFSTVIVYYHLDFSIITVAWFLAGIVLSVIHFVKEELKQEELRKASHDE